MKHLFLKLLAISLIIMFFILSCGNKYYFELNNDSKIVTFEKTIGNNKVKGISIIENSDGGYIITGEESKINDIDIYLCETDKFGNLKWEKTYGGGNYDGGKSVIETSDGGYVVTGRREKVQVYMSLMKFNKSGNLIWEKTFGKSVFSEGLSVCETIDGGFIITGNTCTTWEGSRDNYRVDWNKQDIYLVRTDKNGILIWEKTFGGEFKDNGNSVREISDGSYIIAGSTTNTKNGTYDVYVFKTNFQGELIWEKTFGRGKGDGGNSVCITSDNYYLITGSTYSNDTDNFDVYLIKTDTSGNLVWEKTYGGSSNDYGHSVCETTDGGYIITGSTYSYGAIKGDVYLCKTDSMGNLIWEKTFGGEYQDDGSSVQVTSDYGYIVTGAGCIVKGETKSNSDCGVYLIKTDSEGNVK